MDKLKEKKKVAVGLSGGVDSSVSAYLLKEAGHDVVGVYMKCWNAQEDGCVSDKDKNDAIKICAALNIPFKSLDFVKDYREKVIEYFYNAYESGLTPNPDVMCNREIKFGLFLDWAMGKGFDYVATGHYARISKGLEVESGLGKFQLLKGADVSKDQSYFLYVLEQEQLGKVLFPVGDMLKEEVRGLARKVGFHNFDKPDSVGICFIGDIDVRELLEERFGEKKGAVLSVEGEVIGEHDGVWFYTIGQRHGFRVSKYFGMPLYIVDKNADRNELVVGFTKDVLCNEFGVGSVHWIGDVPKFPLKCDVRVRHLGKLHPATVVFGENGLKVLVDEAIFGVAPGQSAVFYDGDVVLGGGIIF